MDWRREVERRSPKHTGSETEWFDFSSKYWVVRKLLCFGSSGEAEYSVHVPQGTTIPRNQFGLSWNPTRQKTIPSRYDNNFCYCSKTYFEQLHFEVCTLGGSSVFIFAPQGHFRRAGRHYLVGFQPVRPWRHSLCCLESWVDDCATHHGSGIEEVFVRCIEALISAEKLRGTDLCLGPLGAWKSGKTSVMVENSLYRLRFQMVRSFPVGPPCRARLDLVNYK